MKVFRKIRVGRKRFSKASDNLLLSDPAMPSDGSSVCSWGNESSSFSESANQLYLVTEYSEGASNDDAATEASSLPTHVEDLEKDQSPSNWSKFSITTSRSDFSAIVLYQQPKSPRPLPDSINIWLHSVAALIRSREMQALVGSSRDLVTSVVISTGKIAFTAGGLVVDVALLPVTIPCHVASTATGLVAGVAGSVMHKVIGEGGGGQPSGEERRHSESPIDTFIHNIFNVIPFVANTAAQLVAPVLGIENEKQQENETSMGNHWSSPGKEYTTSSGESSAERQHVLDRLKLDFELSTVRKDSLDTAFTRATPSDISKYLLRVDDIIVMVSPDPTSRQSRPRRALFVDIGSEFADDSTTEDALAQLIQRGLDISATNVSAHMAISDYHNSSSIPISWKPEGHTARIARKLVLLDQEECYRKLHNHVLVWSGKYSGPKYYGSENPLFLARGVVRRSPRDFFEMLWDSDRTGEYNHFSLGRSDTLVIDDSISSTGTSGAKVIKSDTKVPFAGITVTLSALMHGKKLNEGTEEGYVIVSRSLCSGMAGCHVGSSKRVEKNNKNEILLGVNIMRPVPGHPELTDLMSVSQVSSSMVPQFLALRIGMMGVDDFFSNVRK